MASQRNNTTTQTAADAAARALAARDSLFTEIDEAVEAAHAELETQRAANVDTENGTDTNTPTNS